MDLGLRILLRKYAANRDLNDARILAEALLRLEETPIEVWVCDVFEDDPGGSTVRLFFDEYNALECAAKAMMRILDSEIAQGLQGHGGLRDAELRREAVNFDNQLQYCLEHKRVADLSNLINYADEFDRFVDDAAINVYQIEIK